MARLESQVRSLEVSVATMGHFIASLAETNSSIEIPGEIRRVVAQLSVAECRRNSVGQTLLRSPKQETQLQKARPVTINEDTCSSQCNIENMRTNSSGSEISLRLKGGEEKPRGSPYPLKPALSSPNLTTKLSGMSSLFTNTHGQIKQQRLNVVNSLTEVTDTGTLIAEKKIPADCTNNDSASVDVTKNFQLSDVANYEKSTSVPLVAPRLKLKSSQSSFELRAGGKNNKIIETTQCDNSDSGNVTPLPTGANHIHPLDTCSDVHFTYGGTTKLKTIRPLRAQLSRNSSVDSISVFKPLGPGGDVSSLSQIIDSKNETSAVPPIGEKKNSLIMG